MVPPLIQTSVLAAGDSALSETVAGLVAILVTAALVALVMQRLRLQTIPAYLISGALLGLTGLAGQAASVQDIADLAIVLLLFGIGMHLDAGSLKVGLRQTLSASTLAVAVSVVALWPLAWVVTPGWHAALALAMALSLSSTAVVLRLLTDWRELHRMHGRISLAVLVVQDIVVIPMLLAVPLLAEAAGTRTPPQTDTGDGGNMLLGTLLSVGAILGIVIVGKVVLPRLLRLASTARSGGAEVMMILAVAYALGAAALTQVLGLSPALGAFLAGFLLGQTDFKYHLSGQVGVIRDLFMAVFFTAVGAKLDLGQADASFLLTVLAGFAVVVAVKAVAIGLACWSSGLNARLSTHVGMGLSPAGEFGIVILGVAAGTENALISPEVFSQGIAIIFLSMLVNPLLLSAGRAMGERASALPSAPWIPRGASLSDAESDGNHRSAVIVAGFGVVGRAVVDRLTKLGVPASVVEMNTRTVSTQRKGGRKILFGDVADPEVLESAGVRDASALVLTIPDETAVLRACRNAKRLNPGIFIVARTTYLSRGMRAASEGADRTVIEEIVTAEAMEHLVEEHCALPIDQHNTEPPEPDEPDEEPRTPRTYDPDERPESPPPHDEPHRGPGGVA